MKKLKFMFGLLFAFCCVVAFSACGSDDDEPANVESYLIGTWRSYQATVNAQNESATLDISKTGQFSQLYMELTFDKNGTVVAYSWDVDEKGLSTWLKETGTYTVSGSSVNVTIDGVTIPFVYDEGGRTLYFRSAETVEGYGLVSVYIYLKK